MNVHKNARLTSRSMMAAAEVFIQSAGMGYATPYASSDQRTTATGSLTDSYISAQPHSGIKGLTPWQHVSNLLGNDS